MPIVCQRKTQLQVIDLEEEQMSRIQCWSANLLTGRSVVRTRPLSRLPLSRLRQPGGIPALLLPSGSMAVRHRQGATAERFNEFSITGVHK
ncbi:hypothetical protein CSKR_104551 [Clonorchis sinensis]|uniref:Uncharacterized protein n=1 Tax=Clonorchis sinensis TaxID=79923 RepID=A0A3R7CRD2_CLOSI|nr:hypothetical protein CSKR_104551 [Clonorchis sinensis]